MLMPKLGWVLGLVSLPLLACSKAESAGAAGPGATSRSSAPAGPIASAASSVGDAGGKPARPARDKLTCAELIPKTVEMGKKLKMPVQITPGSWGKVPKAVQVLPPDGTLCGSVDLMDQAMIITKLDEKDLEAFYGPLFAQAGCEPFTCEDAWDDRKVQMRCQCQGEGFMGSVTTDTRVEAITVGSIEGKFFHKGKK